MSQENVEIVKAAYAAFNRSDFEAVAAALHPEVEWHPYLGGLERSVYRGHDAIRTMRSKPPGGLRRNAPDRASRGGRLWRRTGRGCDRGSRYRQR